MAAEARLSIIETWPDRQKIQKARGKPGGGRKGKDARCLAEHSFPLVRAKVRIFQENDIRTCVHIYSNIDIF